MRSNTKRVIFLIEESLSRELAELVPAGKRNQVVNEALRKELEIIRRKTARNRLVSGSEGKRLSTREIVSALEKDRRKHG